MKSKSIGPLTLASLAACLGVVVLALAAGARNARSEPLPLTSTTRGAHRVQPAKSATDFDCSVTGWTMTSSKPELTLACPGDGSSVRVQVKLSWMDLRDQPADYQNIVAPSGTPTKLRSDHSGASVWLKVRETSEEAPRARWISFNELVNLEVLSQD